MPAHLPNPTVTLDGTTVRAMCSCGYTGPGARTARTAMAGLALTHRLTEPRCSLCGRDTHGLPIEERYAHLRPANAGSRLLICTDDVERCRDTAADWPARLDQATAGVHLADVIPLRR